MCVCVCQYSIYWYTGDVCVYPVCFAQAQRWHQGNEHFGRSWQSGDVVGCMVDMNEQTMMFTHNGEVLLDDSGSELAFKDFEVWEGLCLNSVLLSFNLYYCNPVGSRSNKVSGPKRQRQRTNVGLATLQLTINVTVMSPMTAPFVLL